MLRGGDRCRNHRVPGGTVKEIVPDLFERLCGLLAVNRPDSQQPARTVDGHASVEGLGHLE